MKANIFRRLLQHLGFAYEKRNLTTQSDSASATHSEAFRETPYTEKVESCCWDLDDIRLRAGWYMLELEHSNKSIGCTLTLETSCDEREFLQLTAKIVCKRIIHLSTQLNRCVIRIDQPDCSLGRITFVPLAKRFAINRLRLRLQNRGCADALDALDVHHLYELYTAQFHDALLPQVYRYRAVDPAVPVSKSELALAPQSHIRLLLLRAFGNNSENLDPTVDRALIFGRQSGWQIEWMQENEMDILCAQSHDPENRSFVMPVSAGVEYRIDVFHRMLSEVGRNTHLVYADHDYIDDSGVHVDPVLKPEWNPELLLNFDYIQLPWMISERWARLVLKGKKLSVADFSSVLLCASLGYVGEVENACPPSSLPESGEGALAALRNNEVIRVPQVLASVHRSSQGQSALALSSERVWRQLLADALNNAGRAAQVTGSRYADRHRILWPLAPDTPSVDIIVPTRDKVSVLKTCLQSVLSKTSYTNYRLLVVDNDSRETDTELYYQTLSENARVKLLRFAGAFNYSAINNFAVEQSQADVIVLLNNDTEVISTDWLNELVRQAMRPEIGCVGAKLYYSNGRIQHGGVIVGITGVAGHAHRYSPGDAQGYCSRLVASQNFSAVTAACLAIRRSTWNRVGGLDEVHLGVAWNDVDFCLKVQESGLRNLWSPHAELFHHEGLSRGADNTAEQIKRVDAERKVMIDRWALDGVKDPAYHPLLTHDSEGFGLGPTIC